MKIKASKLTAVLLALCLCVGMLSMVAMADLSYGGYSLNNLPSEEEIREILAGMSKEEIEAILNGLTDEEMALVDAYISGTGTEDAQKLVAEKLVERIKEVIANRDIEGAKELAAEGREMASAYINTEFKGNYMKGDGDGKFRPDDGITRAEVAQLFLRALTYEGKSVEITSTFTDVPEDAWYADAVNTIASLGLVNGFGDGTFKPNKQITRAELVTIAARLVETKGAAAVELADVPMGSWAYDYVMEAIANGWVDTLLEGEYFNPDKVITRGEVTAVINALIGREPVEGVAEDMFTDVPVDHPYYGDIRAASGK